MSWRPFDFQGAANLDPIIFGRLESSLQEKEHRLAKQIGNLIPEEENEAAAKRLKLSEGIELFSKKARFLLKESADWKQEENLKRINHTIWEYVEFIEGAAVEMYRRLRLLPREKWADLSPVVNSIHDLLLHRIDDLIWCIRRLEAPLNKYYGSKSFSTWLAWLPFAKKKIDPLILKTLDQTEKYLKMNYRSFKKGNEEFILLEGKIKESWEKLQEYNVLRRMEASDQAMFQRVFKLLKMIELNHDSKDELSMDLKRSLKDLAGVERVFRLFRKYLNEIQEAVFNISLEWKSIHHEEEDISRIIEKFKAKLGKLGEELNTLMHVMNRYRNYLVQNDPDPYVGTRLGFTEWTVGPEPKKAFQFTQLIYFAEEIKENILDFSHSLEQDLEIQHNNEFHSHEEIEKLLHEMGQPLITKSMMHHRAEKLLNALKICDELGSSQMSTVFYVENIMITALRLDWKTQVLHRFPLFHRLYRIHQGLEEDFDDPCHNFRVKNIKLLFLKILDWINEGDPFAHVDEIELDLNDMKAHLQDFLASIQRTCRERESDTFFDEAINKYIHQLLEYRYLFGQFLSNLNDKGKEENPLYQQLIFVDQYLSSIEKFLKENKEDF